MPLGSKTWLPVGKNGAHRNTSGSASSSSNPSDDTTKKDTSGRRFHRPDHTRNQRDDTTNNTSKGRFSRARHRRNQSNATPSYTSEQRSPRTHRRSQSEQARRSPAAGQRFHHERSRSTDPRRKSRFDVRDTNQFAPSKEFDTVVPTKTFYFIQNAFYSRKISVFDITDQVGIPFNNFSRDFFTRAQLVGIEAHHPLARPAYFIKAINYMGTRNTIQDGEGRLAALSQTNLFRIKDRITFPDSTPQDDTALRMTMRQALGFDIMSRRVRYGGYMYQWKRDFSHPFSLTYTLWRRPIEGGHGNEIPVARYKQEPSWKRLTLGGVMVIDTNKVDEIITVFTWALLLQAFRRYVTASQSSLLVGIAASM